MNNQNAKIRAEWEFNLKITMENSTAWLFMYSFLCNLAILFSSHFPDLNVYLILTVIVWHVLLYPQIL